MTWQYFRFRTIETRPENVPNRFQALPVCIAEANLQMMANKRPGWEANNRRRITECVDYVQTWNAAVGTQPVNGVIFYRWAHDEWRLDDKPSILNRIETEAKKLGTGG